MSPLYHLGHAPHGSTSSPQVYLICLFTWLILPNSPRDAGLGAARSYNRLPAVIACLRRRQMAGVSRHAGSRIT